jgi:3-oxoacyl-[acyl-carrier protein] reductase
VKRLALITGGSGGIGAGVARLLAPDHDLALGFETNKERAEAVKDEIERGNPAIKVRVFEGGLQNYSDASKLVDKVTNEFGRTPAVLVNSAGRLNDTLFLNSDFASHQRILDEHLTVTMALCHMTLKGMYEARFGRIVTIGSVSARYAKRGQCSYAAAKAAVEAFSRTLALEVAHRGITVNVVAPGLIETDLAASAIENLRQKHGQLRQTIPMGEAGTPHDVGALVRFLCSDDARYITGVTYTIDGGRSLGDARL